MKRQVITIQENMVIYAPHHGEVWMTAWEIAELLYVTGTFVNNAIKRIWKQGVLKDFEHSQYIKLENTRWRNYISAYLILMTVCVKMGTLLAQVG